MQTKKRTVVTFSVRLSPIIQEDAERLGITPNRLANGIVGKYYKRKAKKAAEKAANTSQQPYQTEAA